MNRRQYEHRRSCRCQHQEPNLRSFRTYLDFNVLAQPCEAVHQLGSFLLGQATRYHGLADFNHQASLDFELFGISQSKVSKHDALPRHRSVDFSFSQLFHIRLSNFQPCIDGQDGDGWHVDTGCGRTAGIPPPPPQAQSSMAVNTPKNLFFIAFPSL